MQTPKSRPGSLDVPQRPSGSTPRTARKLKAPGSDSDTVLSPNPIIRKPKDRNPKVVDRRSPRSPVIEISFLANHQKKRPSRISELEPQLAQLQEELKKARDQLTSSESSKRRAQQEAEEAKRQLAALSAKLEETQKQLNDISDSEDSRIQELRKISQDRDRAWQSELEAVQKQHTMDSAALVSTMNEIQRLNIQLSQARHAESAAHTEIQSLRVELTETLDLVEKLKNQLHDCRENESKAIEEVSRAEMELEIVKRTEETLQLEYSEAMESYRSLLVELEQSKGRVTSLEEVVAYLQADLATATKIPEKPSSEIKETAVNDLKAENSQLREALEAAERNYQDKYLQSTLEIRNAYEEVERAKTESRQVEAELEAKVKESESEAEGLRMKLIEKQNTFPKVGAQKETEIEIELKKLESVSEELKLSLMEKEMRLQSIGEENEKLKAEIEKWEIERSRSSEEADEERSGEREALVKLGYLTDEADKSCKKAARVTEQLDAALAANSEMEAEFRRLKVQSDQWRKAAEAATAMLSTGNNGKHVERTSSFDYHTVGGKLDMNYSEDMEDESPKKKNGNMLRKIGVLLKKK